jgi:hypothetical protein
MSRTSIPGRSMRPSPTDTREYSVRDEPRSDAGEEVRRERKRKGGGAVDKFYVPQSMIPDGWTYEWKRASTINAPDAAYTVELLENGWTNVPAGRHKQFMPPGYTGETIERDGLVLMERPVYLTDEARAEEAGRTRQQMREKQEALGQSPRDTMERVPAKINRSYEAVPIEE